MSRLRHAWLSVATLLGAEQPGPRDRISLTGPTVPDPLPARGWVRCRHVSQRWKSSGSATVSPDPRRRVPDLHVYHPDPRERLMQLSAQGRSGAVTCPASAGAGASLPLEACSPTRIKCGWLRRALLPQGTGQLLSDRTVNRELPRCAQMTAQ